MINVRRGRAEDHQEVLNLLAKVWDDDYVHHIWLDWVGKPEEGIVLVAEYEGDIVGTCYVDFMPHNTCWFQALRVSPDHRRLGVGSALTKKCIEEAQVCGRRTAYLGIDADNTASLTMTERAGFKKVSEYARQLKSLPAIEGKATAYPAFWRRAVEHDVDDMIKISESQGKSELIACWQWQPCSREAIIKNTACNTLWVWEEEGVRLWAGFEDFDNYTHLFDPSGKPEDIREVITTLMQAMTRGEESTFEVWLHQSNPLNAYLTEQLGFVGDEGYTIWEYKL